MLDRSKRQQPHGGGQDLSSLNKQEQPRLSYLFRRTTDLDRLPCGTDQVRNLEAPSDNTRRFGLLERVFDDDGVHGQSVEDFVDFWVVQNGNVNLVDRVGDDDVGVFPLDRAESDVRVLDERSEISLESRTSLHVKVVVVDSDLLAKKPVYDTRLTACPSDPGS